MSLKDFLSLFKIRKLPSRVQWGKFFYVLSKKEKIVFFVSLAIFLISLFSLWHIFYIKNTRPQPAGGGELKEGVVGQPRFINPIYSQTSDTDRDLAELIFSGLFKYDRDGKIVPDLAANYEIKNEGRSYEVYLKENLFWSDGSPLTADDVVFTIKTIQNSDYKSPSRTNWLGVNVEKISNPGIRFELKNAYAPFLETLTQKIIPQKIWKDISPENFPLAVFNLKPVGSGPYKLKGLKQNGVGKIISLELVKNPRYYGKTPYLHQISFYFFDDEESLAKSFRRGKIDSFAPSSSQQISSLTKSANVYSFSLPRYFALFFNPEKSKILSDQNIRQALNYATDKTEILDKVFGGYGMVTHSPVLPEIYGFETPSNIYEFNLETAEELLDKAGFTKNAGGQRIKTVEKTPAFQFKSNLKKGSKGTEVRELQRCLAQDPEIYPEGEITGVFGAKTKEAVIKFQEKYAKEILAPQGLKKGTGDVLKSTRDKLNEICFAQPEEFLPLKFSLITVDQPVLTEVANIIKNQWQKLGIELEIKTYDISKLETDIIKPRNYEILLFGEALGSIPDPFTFWHSLQKKDPGLNLALYGDKKSDKLLEEARQLLDNNERKKKLESFQNILLGSAPTVFLYSPSYLYLVAKKVQGIDIKTVVDPAKRFIGIENWYIKIKRSWK